LSQQKNHTGRNASYKDHKNGIKKAPKFRHEAQKGMDPKFLRNQRYAKAKNTQRKVKKTK
ncbi:unnamed protein product, partial [Chrysoparadoxa australica]